MQYRQDIQVLRGIAVLAVVLFHASESYFPLGFLGVDVFFVVSGFVVTPLILRIFANKHWGGRLSNLKYFYARRFFRLAPALAVTFIFSVFAVLLFVSPAYHPRFANQGIFTLLLIGNIGAYRFSGDYFTNDPNPFVHTWSLSVEEQIYIFLPLTLMLVLFNHKNPKKTISIVFALVSLISFTIFIFPALLQPIYSQIGLQTSTFSFYSPFERIWQFTLGGLGYLLSDRYFVKVRQIFIFNLFLVIMVFLITLSQIPLGLKNGSIIASFASIFAITFRSFELLPTFLSRKLEWLGDRSYSIYIIHMPLLTIARYSPATSLGMGENRNIQAFIGVVAALFLGSLSYSKIENRFRDKNRSGKTGNKTILVSLSLTVVVPLSLCVAMIIGEKHQYWGLDRNISPTISQDARNMDPKCNRMSVRPEPCLYIVPNSQHTVLLIGDSHAAHISQAIFDASKNKNWNSAIWTLGGCFVQFQRSIESQIPDECLNQNLKILNWIKEKKPDVVFVSQSVQFNTSQEDLANALLVLNSLTPKLVLIENNPVFPDGKDFRVRRPIIMPVYLAPKSFTVSEMDTTNIFASKQLASFASNNSISTIDFSTLFCKENTCSRYSDAGWLYGDADHFTVAGAKLTIPLLESFLK